MAAEVEQTQPRPPTPAPDGYRWFTSAVSLAPPLVLTCLVVVIGREAWPAISHYGLRFLIVRAWNPVRLDFGALTFIYGTLVTSALALLAAFPVGVAVALFLAEPGARRVRSVMGTGIELLAAIPSVVYGIWGLYVLAPWLLLHVSGPVSQRLGTLPLFAGPARQSSILTASVVLAVMVLPTLAAVSREVVRAIPAGLKEASFALGATWWETTWRVVLPAARPGIFGATILALGRALGETIAVTMTIGNRPEVQSSVFGSAYTLASVIANEFTEATGQLYPAALLELGLILIMITLLVNVGALLLVRRVTEPGPAR
ncbi:MAG TPA: phosphate ABC transporter permease subunit PstC [Candidatus Nitrosotalea sp.]|nr:phosphate ABC transporter permease subunit PstC [Candidatus Nitrosotalea sp.]